MTTTPSARPFHYSFYVRDLDEARRFYGTLLGCREGRSTATWVDFDFFGNQISCHLTETVPATRDTGKVDDVLVPMPHFGAVLAWDDFARLADRLRNAGARRRVLALLSARGVLEADVEDDTLEGYRAHSLRGQLALLCLHVRPWWWHA
jgi:extradiol dioxygenase family protein